MDAVLLSRVQFALTVGFHYVWPPLTIGLAWLIVWMKIRFLRTGDTVFQSMARFWTRLFALSFVTGVATGITLEFQFGTNWAAYSRFVGDVFGPYLAAEVLLSFFLESIFLGLLVFGEKRLSRPFHLVSALLVALGATLSAFWIVAANSWQQTPAGYQIENGRAELTDFCAALFNPSTFPRFLHTFLGALITGACFVLGISAFYLLRGRQIEFAKRSLRIALVVGSVSAFGQLFSGDLHAIQVAKTQPEKLATYEGLFETTRSAPLLLFGIPDEETERTDFALRLPGWLSWLVGGSVETEVRGLKDFPKEEWPPLRLTFFSFHLMVLLGVFLIGFTGLGLVLWWRRKVDRNRFFLRLALLATPLPFVANELGWIAAEVGRQPWAVYRLLRTDQAISVTVPPGQMLFSTIAFFLMDALLLSLWLFLLRRKIKKGPDAPDGGPTEVGGV